MAKTATCKKQRGQATFMNSAMLLAVAGFISKFLGALYRIPLTNILGAEGIGLYQLVFPIYALVLTMSSGSIPTATARLVAEKSATLDNDGSRNVFRVSAILLTVTGLIAMTALFFLAAPIARLQGNIDIRAGYLAVAPAVLVVAVTAAFKGWFQGNMNMKPSAVSQVVEQIVKMAAGLVLAWLLMPKGVMYAVTGALVGLTVAEVFSFITVLIMYLRDGGRIGRIQKRLEFKRYADDIIKLSAPIFFSSLIFPISNFIDSLLIVNVLDNTGIGHSESTALYGIFTGPVNSMINMPVIVALAVAIAIVPVVSRGRVFLDACGIKQKSSVALKSSYLIGIPCMVVFIVLAEPIISVLYRSFTAEQVTVAANLLKLSAINVVLLSQVQIYSSLLQALDKSKIPVIALGAGVLVKIVLNIVLIPYISIYGASIATTACFLTAALISGLYYKYLLGVNKKLLQNILKIASCSVIMGAVIMIINQKIPGRLLSLLLCAIVGVVLYVILVFLFKVYEKDELKSLPFGEKLSKFADRF